MEETPKETQEEEKIGSVRHWVEENLRLIVSVVIVIALGATIYSYSQRTKESTVVFENGNNTQEQVLVDNNGDKTTDSQQAADTAGSDQQKNEQSTMDTAPAKPEVTSMETSRETSDAFIAVAQKGDGLTHLARKALADYLAKNPDSQLTVAHKIYIEDALRKAVNYKGGIHVGTEMSFSKDLIQKTVEQAKSLNERQLQNLQKYVPLVPSLS